MNLIEATNYFLEDDQINSVDAWAEYDSIMDRIRADRKKEKEEEERIKSLPPPITYITTGENYDGRGAVKFFDDANGAIDPDDATIEYDHHAHGYIFRDHDIRYRGKTYFKTYKTLMSATKDYMERKYKRPVELDLDRSIALRKARVLEFQKYGYTTS